MIEKVEGIVFDLDGTIIRSDETACEYGLDMIRRASKVVPVGINSGRYREFVKNFATEKLNLRSPQVSENGAYIFELPSNKTLSEEYIPDDDATLLFELIKGYKKPYIFHDKQGTFNTQSTAFTNRLTVLTVSLKSKKEGEEIMSGIEERFSFIQGEFSRGSQGQWYLVLTKEGVNKGYGVELFSKYTNTKLENIAAFGDGPNDIPMFAKAGIPFAMGNSSNEVKKLAKYTAGECDKKGLANAIEELLF